MRYGAISAANMPELRVSKFLIEFCIIPWEPAQPFSRFVFLEVKYFELFVGAEGKYMYLINLKKREENINV